MTGPAYGLNVGGLLAALVTGGAALGVLLVAVALRDVGQHLLGHVLWLEDVDVGVRRPHAGVGVPHARPLLGVRFLLPLVVVVGHFLVQPLLPGIHFFGLRMRSNGSSDER